METETILCWGKHTAHFLFSTSHLLLTRILPLIAMLVGSLLLHLLRLVISFLSPMARSLKTLLLKKNPSESARHGSPATFINSSADHALQEEGLDLYSDPEELGASAGQEVLAYSDHEPDMPDLHLQEERFEDCFDADFIEGQRLLLKQYEDMNRRVETTTNREVSEAASVEQMMGNPVGNSLQQRLSRDQFWQGRHEYSLRRDLAGRPLPQAGDNLRQSGVRGANSEREIGYSVEEEVGANDVAGMHGSQPSALFPSDLPSTLDDVVQAAKDDAERSRHRSGRAPSLTRRSIIPPTLSDVQKALQEMRAEENHLHANTGAAPFSQAQLAMPANPAARTTSYDNFLSKFTQHFKLDRN